jgi:MFS family permease
VRITDAPQFPPAHPLNFVSLMTQRPVIWMAAAVAGLMEAAVILLLPVFGLSHGLSEIASLRLVAAYLAGCVVLALPIGYIADCTGRRVVLGCCAVSGVLAAILLVPLLSYVAALVAVLFIWGCSTFAFYTLGMSLLADEFRSDALGSANTAFIGVYSLATTVGPGLYGLSMDHSPGSGFVAFAAAVLELFFIGFWCCIGRLSRHSAQQSNANARNGLKWSHRRFSCGSTSRETFPSNESSMERGRCVALTARSRQAMPAIANVTAQARQLVLISRMR